MSRATPRTTQTTKPSAQIVKRCVSVAVFVALIAGAYAAWDEIGGMRFGSSVVSTESSGGYDNFFPKTSNGTSLGYSTGPDDKSYLKLPGVPDSPRRAP